MTLEKSHRLDPDACEADKIFADLVLEPGQAVYRAKRLLLGCADGTVEVLTLKPDGKKSMDAQAFAAGIQNIKKTGAMWSAV